MEIQSIGFAVQRLPGRSNEHISVGRDAEGCGVRALSVGPTIAFLRTASSRRSRSRERRRRHVHVQFGQADFVGFRFFVNLLARDRARADAKRNATRCVSGSDRRSWKPVNFNELRERRFRLALRSIVLDVRRRHSLAVRLAGQRSDDADERHYKYIQSAEPRTVQTTADLLWQFHDRVAGCFLNSGRIGAGA